MGTQRISETPPSSRRMEPGKSYRPIIFREMRLIEGYERFPSVNYYSGTHQVPNGQHVLPGNVPFAGSGNVLRFDMTCDSFLARSMWRIAMVMADEHGQTCTGGVG
jgi:hypothetical protein